jgi:hypothetical protein
MLWSRIKWAPVLFWYAFNPYLSPDSYWYATAGLAIRTDAWRENYVWNRTPGYPVLITIVSLISQKYLFELVSLVQIVSVFFVFSKLRDEILNRYCQELGRDQFRSVINYSLFLSFILLGGYLSAILPQALITVGLVWQAIYFIRVDEKASSTIRRVVEFLLLIAVMYAIHPLLAANLLFVSSLYILVLLIRPSGVARKQTFSIGFCLTIGIVFFISIHIMWSQFATDQASKQVQSRQEVVSAIESTCNNYSLISGYNCQTARGALVTDPLFVTSVFEPLKNDPFEVIQNLPKRFFNNVIGSPASGPNVSIGFYRLFSGIEQCVSFPSSVILSVEPGLFSKVQNNCRISSSLFMSEFAQKIAKLIYVFSWFIAILLLLLHFVYLLVFPRNFFYLAICPICFVLLYSLLRSSENRYGAPALPILLIIGAIISIRLLSRLNIVRLRNSKLPQN